MKKRVVAFAVRLWGFSTPRLRMQTLGATRGATSAILGRRPDWLTRLTTQF
jgi:hypothetical protein